MNHMSSGEPSTAGDTYNNTLVHPLKSGGSQNFNDNLQYSLPGSHIESRPGLSCV